MKRKGRVALRQQALAEAYLGWLMRERGYDHGEAAAYVAGGDRAVALYRQKRNAIMGPREHAADRYADADPVTQRFIRRDHDCFRPGCDLMADHSGPHHVRADLREAYFRGLTECDQRSPPPEAYDEVNG